MSQLWSKILVLFFFAATVGGFSSIHNDSQTQKSGLEFSSAKAALVIIDVLPVQQEHHSTKEIRLEDQSYSGQLANNAHTQKRLFLPRLLKFLPSISTIKIINTLGFYSSSQNFPEAVLHFRKKSFLSIVARE